MGLSRQASFVNLPTPVSALERCCNFSLDPHLRFSAALLAGHNGDTTSGQFSPPFQDNIYHPCSDGSKISSIVPHISMKQILIER